MNSRNLVLYVLAAILLGAARPAMAQHRFIAFNAVTIPRSDLGTMGIGSSYPNLCPVTGVRHPVGRVSVTLSNLSHTYPDDLDIVLVSPRGLAVVLMSDAGGSTDFAGTFFIDESSPPIPDSGALTNFSRYSPADYDPGDPPPGLPAGLTFTTLAGLSGSDANGYWEFYVYDDAVNDSGRMDPPVLEISEAFDGPISIDETRMIALPDRVDMTRTLRVAGLNDPVHNLVVRLYRLSHTYPRDLDIGVVDPRGRLYILMSDAGGTSPVSDVTLEFGLFAADVPESSLPSGRYRGTNYNDGGPQDLGGVVGTAASEGLNASGEWTLRILDDQNGDSGFFTGWSLVFEGPCKADLNHDGTGSIQDLFDYLAAWFAGCP